MTSETHLFDKKSHWLTEPMTAFGGFVTSVEFVKMGKRPKRVGADGTVQEHQPLGHRSVKGYMAMFSKFVRWMSSQNLKIDGVAKEHILQFLNAEMEPQKKRFAGVTCASWSACTTTCRFVQTLRSRPHSRWRRRREGQERNCRRNG
jgi:hypothetical protein